MTDTYDAIVVGAGLAGLVTACELGNRGKKVLVLDQEPEHFLGGQAFWSLGGLSMIDTPEQRRFKIKDSRALAGNDWMASAGFDRAEDHWPRKWAEAYLDFAAGEMRPWLHSMGMRWFPVVGWAERGGGYGDTHGNSVPRFHITWGTGPGVLEPFIRRAREHEAAGRLSFAFRHRCQTILRKGDMVTGITAEILAPDTAERGAETNRQVIGQTEFHAPNVIIASGGVGGNLERVLENWPVERLGQPPKDMVMGVPKHVDGDMMYRAQDAGGHIINNDRMWHYCEGLRNWNPIWPGHGIRVLPGPSSMWFDAEGNRLPTSCLPGFNTLETLRNILATGHDYSWFIMTQKVIKKEMALSGSEQNPDFTSKSWQQVLKSRVLNKMATPPVEAFKEHGEDFVVADNLSDLVDGMNAVGTRPLDLAKIQSQIEARDLQVDNPFTKDAQITAINGARNYLGDKLIRTAKPHKFLDPANGPLIAVRLHILTRKTLGGLHTNLEGQMLNRDGAPLPGLYAVGEAAGFGGGGYHGYNSLEGTFLGGCIFTGRQVGRSETLL